MRFSGRRGGIARAVLAARDLIEASRASWVVEPGEKAHHGRTVLAMDRGAGGDLGLVLDRRGAGGRDRWRLSTGAAGRSRSASGLRASATSGSTIRVARRTLPGGFQRIIEMPDGGLEFCELGEIGLRLDAGLALVDEELRPASQPG